MSDWKRVKISEVSDFFIGGTPSRSNPNLWAEKPSGHPWIAISDLKQKYISDTEEHITSSGVTFSNVKEIPPESVVMSFKLSIGKAAITKQLMYCNEAIVFFKPNEELSSRWLYHAIPKAANAVIVDTAVKVSTLNKKKIADIELFLPSIEEQTTIATILDTLDTQIRQTEAIIAKLQQVKQGLLHDLLTRGIDANGQLRPPREQAPELYQESPLGWIPKDWELSDLANSVDLFSGGTPSKSKKEWWNGDVPLLTPKDMKKFELNQTIDNVTAQAAKVGSRLMPPETVFIVVRGMILAHSFPVVFGQCSMAFNQDIKAVFGRGLISQKFLAFWFVSWSGIFLRKVTESTHGTKKLDTSELLSFSIGVPSKAEQAEIVGRLESVANQIDSQFAELSKLKKQKAGLMDDLLTGRVRVTELIDQAQQAS